MRILVDNRASGTKLEASQIYAHLKRNSLGTSPVEISSGFLLWHDIHQAHTCEPDFPSF